MRKSAPVWARFDVLVRELGALRLSTAAARDAAPDVADAVERHLAEAAAAVNAVADDPSDDELAVAAWESILLGRHLVQSVKGTRGPSRELARGSIEIRRRAV